MAKPRGRPVGYEVSTAACPRHDPQIRQWASAGLSLSEIARRIGTKNQCVRQYITRHGIEYRYQHSVGQNNSSWTGGKILDKHGYVLLWYPDHPSANSGGYVREHRLVMETILGRYLQPQEVVHHIDDTYHGRQNNSPDNLKLYTTNSDHLAETLRGRIPHWTEDGKRRILERDTHGVTRWFAANGHKRLRDIHGRFRTTDGPASKILKPKCRCGAMTLERAAKRNHKC